MRKQNVLVRLECEEYSNWSSSFLKQRLGRIHTLHFWWQDLRNVRDISVCNVSLSKDKSIWNLPCRWDDKRSALSQVTISNLTEFCSRLFSGRACGYCACANGRSWRHFATKQEPFAERISSGRHIFARQLVRWTYTIVQLFRSCRTSFQSVSGWRISKDLSLASEQQRHYQGKFVGSRLWS